MDSLKVMGLCVILLLPIVVVKKKLPEQGMLLTIAAVLIVVYRCILLTAPLMRTIEEIIGQTGLEGEYFGILLRTVAVSIVSHLCADLCRDGGSQALATAVELSGASAALVIGFPLLEAVVDLLLNFIG